MHYLLESDSKLVLRTRAQGLLAKLAHDLSIASSALEGHANVEGERWSAELTIPTSSLRVEGVVRGDKVETGVLSEADRVEIERRLVADVIGAPTVRVEARGDTRSKGMAKLTIKRAGELPLTLEVSEREHGLTANIRGTVSLSALGVAEVKGPLGAFKVADGVSLQLFATLRPE